MNESDTIEVPMYGSPHTLKLTRIVDCEAETDMDVERNLLNNDSNHYTIGYAELPRDILHQIFNMLDPKSLINVSHVCSAWRNEAFSEQLWERIAYMKNYRLSSKCVNGDDLETYRDVGVRGTVGWMSSPVQVIVVADIERVAEAQSAARMLCNMAILSGFSVLPVICSEDYSETIQRPTSTIFIYLVFHHNSSHSSSNTVVHPLHKLSDTARLALKRAADEPTAFQGVLYGVYVSQTHSQCLDMEVASMKYQFRACGASCLNFHVDPNSSADRETYDCHIVSEDFRIWNRKFWRLCEKKRGWAMRRKQLNLLKEIKSPETTWTFQGTRLALLNQVKSDTQFKSRRKRKFIEMNVFSASCALLVAALGLYIQQRYGSAGGNWS
eukprot:CFRG5118T1